MFYYTRGSGQCTQGQTSVTATPGYDYMGFKTSVNKKSQLLSIQANKD